ncbi:2-keto-4-pentenoate hydratase [Panacagrimonas perspica]|uniref:2-keto-4-pentenoate hydratase n=1 Tax=Panacagrimonas perspica TaxID=381431 RepID=A0A4R7PCR6_9GAMM|nr:fumarylacetoacetate hydrolase family protein [Panacagrimonas perspica]TDU31924.1 2-keto-4-pentenoate hydratase [Panacagrimonas perspica]THD04244.1 2-keto-4-pentenoate hydratase [Panacagrimonas perspica]
MTARSRQATQTAAPSPDTLTALSLREAYRTGIPCAPIRDLVEAGDVQAAYGIQEINTQHWLAAGRRLVGRKIGLTSLAVQQQLGVDQPDFGMLFADMAACDGDPIPAGAVLQPKAEAEIAFVLERDLSIEQPTMADVIRAVAYATVAIEVVGSRIANWDIKLVDTVADNASSGMFVLGNTPFALNGLDLRDCRMQMLRTGGDVISTGVGHACLGHPLNATLWLARKMIEVGRPLKAGDVILSGALGPMVAAKPGDVFEAQVTGLGSVRAAFA